MTIKEKEDQSYNFKNTHNEKLNEDNEDKQSEKASLWLKELDSLAIKKGNYNKNQSNYLQNLIRHYMNSHHSE